ncbi:MAG: hypothetical protein WDW36_002670 [Sanguina aurantia]
MPPSFESRAATTQNLREEVTDNHRLYCCPASLDQCPAQGYAVLDDVLCPSTADALRAEIVALKDSHRLHKNSTHLVQDGKTQLLEKEHILEAELTLDTAIQEAAPLCADLAADRTLAIMLSLLAPQLSLGSQAAKLQYNCGGGGCFPLHFDSDESLDARKVTAIFYLNPGWTADQGGALRLFPFPAQQVDILPAHNRLVLFSTARMLHRVMPSQAEGRVCITVWLTHNRRDWAVWNNLHRSLGHRPLAHHGSEGSSAPDAESSVQLLMAPHVRKHACKYVYRDEWAASLRESHPPSAARDTALEKHWQEVAIIKDALSRHLPFLEEQHIKDFKPAWF